MTARQFILPITDELIVDLFAGGGGASTGIEMALGRHVDIAINHNPEAVGMHRVNHPQAKHFCCDVFEVDPAAVCEGRPVGHLHASPDCTHFSQAKGGQPRSSVIRALSWVIHRWAGKVRPRVISLENVEQMLQWSPLIAKRDPATGRVMKVDKSVAAPGEHVPRHEQWLIPNPKKKGQNWNHFVAGMHAMGYVGQWRVMVNADHAAHSTRERLYGIFRCDGEPIVWPEATHSKGGVKGRQAWKPASECIDWSIKGNSIFGRKKDLAEPTLVRIATGMWREVIQKGEKMFIVPMTHGGGVRVHSATEPVRTITTASRGELAIATATLVQMGYGEREGQAPRVLDLGKPLGTAVAGGIKHAVATAFMVQANGGFNKTPAHDVRRPVTAITKSGSQQQLITAHLTTLRKNAKGKAVDVPLPTISAGGEHQALVEYHLSKEHEEGALRCAAFLMRYHGDGGQWADLRDPMKTVTTKDRLALVTVWFKGEPWVIVDICLRMLTPRELFNAQDFPAHYVIDHGIDEVGKRFELTKTAQVRMVGNSVCPLVIEKIVAANHPSFITQKVAA